jgi:hypothetical protein
MKITALACPSWTTALPGLDEVHRVPERPGKDDVDPLLTDGSRLVVAGTDADLAAVAVRLLRTERLATVELAYLPVDPHSPAVQAWRLPTGPSALAAIVAGPAHPVPLVRDDAGGVLMGKGSMRIARGEAYCDAELVLRGAARRLVVSPLAPVGVQVRVSTGTLRRRVRAAHGRALQVGCLETTVTCDAVEHPRPVKRWVWYKHTEDLRLVGTGGP